MWTGDEKIWNPFPLTGAPSITNIRALPPRLASLSQCFIYLKSQLDDVLEGVLY